MSSSISSPSSTNDLNSLKSKLKSWERQFKSNHSRQPTKSDIKANPDIAKMYSIYNLARSQKNKSSVSNSNHSTPKKQQSNQISNSSQNLKLSSTKFTHINSTNKLKKLASDHSPRKTTKSQSIHLKNSIITPKSNPFDSNSGGGKGSPNLFADLLIHSNKDTPRTKARKFLNGTGSPLKLQPQLHSSDGNSSIQGLSSFLKLKPDSNLNHSTSQNISDQDEEILGPSPFKPKSNFIFTSLLDEPDQDSIIQNSPTKSLKWKITSLTPFISNSKNQSSNLTFNNLPESAQRQPFLKKKKTSSIGIKRKRILPNDDDKNFYQDLTDHQPSKVRNLTRALIKKKKIESSQSITSTSTTRANLVVQKTKLKSTLNSTNQLSQEIPNNSDNSDSNPENNLPNLPYGDPDQPNVVTQFDTFTFTNLAHSQTDSNSKTLDKGKEKEKEHLEDSIPSVVKLGSCKVLVRPYRPVELNHTNLDLSFTDHPPEPELDLQHNIAEEEEDDDEDETKLLWDDNEQLLSDDEKLLAEGDIEISEELMKILSIKDGIAGQDRRQLTREKIRKEQVRRILDGRSIMERTLSGTQSTQPKSITQPKRTNLKSDSGLNSIVSKQKSRVDDDLRLELALEDRENEEEEEENFDEDEDWEEDPEGWKEVDDGLYLNDEF